MRVICTDGVTASSAHMSRPFGIERSSSTLKFCCTRVAVVSITGEAPVTVTVSCSVASVSSTLRLAVKPSEICTPSRLRVLKPASSYVTV